MSGVAVARAPGSSLSNAALRLDQELLRLQLAGARLESAWSGETQLAFVSARQQWGTSMTSLKDVLAAVSTLCGDITEAYEATEKKIEGQFA